MGGERRITRSEIEIEDVRSLGFRDIIRGVALRGLILQSVECICIVEEMKPWVYSQTLSL
jgi:hypothetical protein